MKLQADQHKSERSFQIGDMMFLKLQSYRQTSITSGRIPKLSPKFYSPFKVLDTIGNVAYKLDLHPESQIHDVFHVYPLKKMHLVILAISFLYPLSLTRLRYLNH